MKKIKFIAPTESQPYEVIKYLQGFSIKCKPIASIQWLEDGDRICSLMVEDKQYRWAMGLIQGYKNYRVISNEEIKPIKPKSRWNGKSAKAEGLIGNLFSVIDKFVGVEVELPKVKKK